MNRLRAAPSRRGIASTPLIVIAAFFAASGLFRLGDDAGVAIAREAGDLVDPSGTEASLPPPDLSAALAAVREREARLEAREATLNDRLQALTLAEEAVARNMDALEAAEARLRSLLATIDETAENDLAQLTAVYENMKPKEAGPLFERMSPEFAAGFLGRMRPDAAAAIMAGLPPDVAYSISVLLASRSAAASRAAVGPTESAGD